MSSAGRGATGSVRAGSKRPPPSGPRERGARGAVLVVGDGSFTPSRGRYAIWGISKWRDAGRVLTDDSGRVGEPALLRQFNAATASPRTQD